MMPYASLCDEYQCPCHHTVAQLVATFRRYDAHADTLRAQIARWQADGQTGGSYALFVPFDLVLALLDAAEVPDARA
jgi:hypothetical protein